MYKLLVALSCFAFFTGCVQADLNTESAVADSGQRDVENTGPGVIDTEQPPEPEPEPEPQPDPAPGDGGGTTDPPPSNNPPSTTECIGAEHQGAIWTVHDCGPYDKYTVPQSGMPTPLKGKLTFKVTNLDRSEISDQGIFFIFGDFFGNGGQEVNFSNVLWNSGGNNIATYLISQRFDGTCSPFCEAQDRQFGVQYDRNTTYHYDIEWDTTTIWETITDGQNVLYGGSVPTNGSYTGMNYFSIGNRALSSYGGVRSTLVVTDIRFSILR